MSVKISEMDFMLVLGGDGTMHEVINGMLSRNDNTNIPIGLLPTGSGNSLIHDLNQLNIKHPDFLVSHQSIGNTFYHNNLFYLVIESILLDILF